MEVGTFTDGQMMRIKSGLGMLVAGTPIPVVPCYLEGTFEAGPAGTTPRAGSRWRGRWRRPSTA